MKSLNSLKYILLALIVLGFFANFAQNDYGFDIAVRAGLHCAPLAHRALGTLPDGTVRISPGWFTTSEEIALFSDAVAQCIAKIRKKAE